MDTCNKRNNAQVTLVVYFVPFEICFDKALNRRTHTVDLLKETRAVIMLSDIFRVVLVVCHDDTSFCDLFASRAKGTALALALLTNQRIIVLRTQRGCVFDASASSVVRVQHNI